MRRISRVCLPVVLFVLGGLPLTGCGSASKLKGQVLQDGQTYKFADGETMTIDFASTSGKRSASTTVANDGSFVVEGEPLPADTYVANVTSIGGPNTKPYQDKFNGAFNGPNNPLKIEIAAGTAPFLEIDVGKKTVTKK